MSVVVTPQLLGSMFVGFKTIFNDAFRGIQPQWQRLATLVPSGTSEERYGWLGDMPMLREWVGDRHVAMLRTHGYTIVNQDFEATVGIKKTVIEDDQYGTFRPIFQALGERAAQHPDRLVFGLLAQGFTEKCYDGKPFFHAEHAVGKAKVPNLQPGSEAPWYLLDTRSALRPLIYQRRAPYNLVPMTRMDDEEVFSANRFRYGVDGRGSVGFGFWQQAYGSKAALNAANFEAAFEAMLALHDDEGQPLGVSPSLLVVGASNRANALRTVEAMLINGGESNINYKAVEVLITPLLP